MMDQRPSVRPAAIPRYANKDTELPRVAAVIATFGRPSVVTATVSHLMKTQTLKPSALIISVARAEDAGALCDLPGATVVIGPPGLTRQRNAALAILPGDTDIVAFFDDDFVADREWLEVAANTFMRNTDVVGFTGHVLVDGIHGPGLSFDQALAIVAGSEAKLGVGRNEPCSPYGCNMAFRVSAIGSTRFDERLVLYGWQEDRDFGAAVAKNGGRLIRCANARGVHLGVKGGRVSGQRLGYSQVVNPLYMMRKGTMSVGQVADHILRNMASNMAKSIRPEPFVDRRGRLIGNLRGFADVLRGRLRPERAADIGNHIDK